MPNTTLPDPSADFLAARRAVPGRPLFGLTVLVVEDSRYACEALRLLCLHSGARLRRADCLAAARRHLQVYRPDVLIVDMGLPDGPGDALISELAQRPQRPGVILAISGDPMLGPAALAAGADGFLEKPVESLRAFQCAILERLPQEDDAVPRRPSDAPEARLTPDPIALRDDLIHAAGILAAAPDAGRCEYLGRFLAGVARSARDAPLADAARELVPGPDQPRDTALGAVAGLLQDRLAMAPPIWTVAPRAKAEGGHIG